MAETENLKFPIIPDYITNLSPIEERMVSPYIPFMQIKALQPYALNSQLSLQGSVVNIVTDVNEMINVLPRRFNELSVVQIKLKRHIEHQSNYMFETIKPSNICKALKFLKDTPLYKENNIQINNTFFENYENNDKNINFIVDEQDLENSQNTNDENLLGKINELKNNENELLDTYELNDEVLLVDNNELSNKTQNSIVIAPGQDKQPLPWHKLQNYDELCFPRIFEIEKALDDLELQDDDDEDDENDLCKKSEKIDILQQIGNEKTNKKVYKLLFPKIITKKKIFDQMNLLNKKQREIVMHVLHSFKTDKLPLRIFINGSASVGKSTVINTLYQLLTIQFNEQPGENTENNKILLCAPSGKAAYLIGGITCHHAFALPVTKNGQKMKPLSEDIASTIRCNF
ncbi:hypothetical protein TKK_0003347 [Trichogramma kaykai]